MSQHDRSDRRIALVRTVTDLTLILRLAGDLDLYSAADTGSVLLASIAELPPPELVVLDLTSVGLLSAAGVHALNRVVAECGLRAIRVRLVAEPGSAVQHVLLLAGLAHDVRVFTSVDRAVRP